MGRPRPSALNALIADRPAPGPVPNWRAVRDHGCTGKIAYSVTPARDVAREMTRKHPGQTFQAYRCPWSHHGSKTGAYHVGHPMSLGSMETLAAALRARAADPTADDETNG